MRHRLLSKDAAGRRPGAGTRQTRPPAQAWSYHRNTDTITSGALSCEGHGLAWPGERGVTVDFLPSGGTVAAGSSYLVCERGGNPGGDLDGGRPEYGSRTCRRSVRSRRSFYFTWLP